ncbi:MAG: peptide chain release factor 2 [Spirochaetota bacterium]|nr:peptide chain release factor 2 [Spirochaetota bacterium]
MYNKTRDFAESINLDGLKGELEELRKKTLKDDFWKDRERFTEVNLQISRIEKRVDYWDRLIKDITEERDLMEMALAESDEEILSEICDKIGIFKNRFDELETLELFSGEDDQKNVFLTIHPGAGGTESQDWAIMLYRMYLRWAENRNHNIDIIDYTPGEDAGIKEATIRIIGDYAYGMLKSERGIHRLVRISPFDANRRRHTSFASVEVIPEVFDDVDIEIDESELRIDTYRASGAGGQHVNTTDSAVRITHLPTGIVVQCQNERSQHKNRAFAMKILKSKIYELKKKRLDEERMERIGEKKDISWGNQIRSYIFQPYTLVKDHRTSEETGNVESVLDGEIDRFIYAYLRDQKKN